MSGGQDKDDDCLGCTSYHIPYDEEPCNDCTRAFSGRTKDYFFPEIHIPLEKTEAKTLAYVGGNKLDPTPSYYNYTYKGIKFDIYRAAEIWGITSNPQFHALKKIARAHVKNHKSLEQNIDEAVDALTRWKEMLNE